jgi:hypothetical protein
MPANAANSTAVAPLPTEPMLANLAPRPVVSTARASRISTSRALSILMLTLAAILFSLHFVHLKADFPNHSPWVDWSKYTDEGWYGDAAIRQSLSGHWYWKGDFNPAVVLPVWPAIEYVAFKFTGVSAVAARSTTLCIFALTLLTLYLLIQRHTRPRTAHLGRPVTAPLTVLLLCASPLFFVFERMAILEPLLILLTALALLAASHLHPKPLRRLGLRTLFLNGLLPSVCLTLLLPAMVLTKTTAICLFPAIFYMVWARAGYRFRPALRLALPPAIGALALWCAYFFLWARPHYLEDYHYLFSANAYTGIELEPVARVVLNTIVDGAWMGTPLYLAFFVILALVAFWRARLLSNPLFTSLLLWIAGYFVFLAYHNNLQPRYYLVVAAPLTIVVALGIDSFRQPLDGAYSRSATVISTALATIVVLAIVVPDTIQQAGYLLHPTYDFEAAAQGIKQAVLADKTHPHLILSISGSELTLMTGLPSIDDDFGTASLEDRVKQYRPGWYVAWNEVDDDKADSLTLYYQLQRVAAFPAYDDPDRNLLILYRLNPLAEPQPTPHPAPKRHIPKPLITKVGQQPSNDQLEH